MATRRGMRAALDDVSFDVEAGQSIAVIGPNGAGKSTALRIAARVTAPSSGRVRARGRVGALIEVGAGIHPELSGRENIWLYGAILGLRRSEIAARFDEIVAFAELESSLDQQVKRYSSGMQLRLGFAIAAGVEPDVLVVDEALAVGDARFQIRCLERMAALVRSGTTLLYVSHDLASVQAACERALLLVGGRVHHDGPAPDTVAAYVRLVESGLGEPAAAGPGDAMGAAGRTRPAVAAVVGADGRPQPWFRPGDPLIIQVPLEGLATDRPGASGMRTIALGIRDGNAWNVLGSVGRIPLRGGASAGGGNGGAVARCHIDALPLGPGVYQVWVDLDGDGADGVWRMVGGFRVHDPDAPPRPLWLPPVVVEHHWDVTEGRDDGPG